MGYQDGAGPGSGAGEDRSMQVIELRERILQLAGHDCHEEEEKSRTELMEDLNICKRDTLIELCHSFDIAGSKANKKEELVSFLMKFLKNNCSHIDATIPIKAADLREQILQLAGHGCHEEQEKSQTELLERLNVCKRDTLIDLCRSFDIIGSRANRKEELVSFLMKFVKEDSYAIDGTNTDKKLKKRRRVNEEEKLSSGKPLKRKKLEGSALETQDEEEANDWKAVEHRRNYCECDGKDNNYSCADNKNGKFPKDKANLEPTVRINGSMSDNVDAVTLYQAAIGTNEQVLTTIPSVKLVTTAEVDSTYVKASKKNSSVIKEKATPKNDHKVKSSGKRGSIGDANPRKQTMKPSRDELREAIVLILDSTDFATMTFGDVVKEVDKYFQKDLFQRKPLIRSLIEEELFRLSEEAEKRELEEEAAEAKARAEQSTKETSQVQIVRTDINKPNKQIASHNSNAAGGSPNGKADAGTKKGENEPSNDSKCEKVPLNANSEDDILGSGNGEVAFVNVKYNNVDALQDSKNGRTKEACNGEHDDAEYGRIEGGRSENGGNSAKEMNVCEAEEPNARADDERVKHAVDGKAKEASSVAIRGDNDGKEKEGNTDAEESPTDSGSDDKAEDADFNVNTKVDVDSGNNGSAENGSQM